MPIGRIEAQKTPEQLAEEDRRQQAILHQKQHDAFLLTTYSSIADIERLRDERLARSMRSARAAEQYVENLQSRLSRAADPRAAVQALQPAQGSAPHAG